MNKSTSYGFSSIEALLIFVIVGIIAGVGFFVYRSQQSTNATFQNTEEAQSSTPGATAESESDAQNNNEASFFEVKELGVKFKLTDNLDGLYYVVGQNGKSVYFSLETLKGTGCAADKTPQVALTRYTTLEYNTISDPTAGKSYAKKIGDYYFFSSGGQAMCSENKDAQAKASRLRSDILKYLPDALVPIE